MNWMKKKKEELIAALITGPTNSFVDAKRLRSNLGTGTTLRNKIKYINSIIINLRRMS